MPDLRPEVERKCSPGRAEASFSSFFFRSLDCGCCPASGLGRLPAGAGGERGKPLYTPCDPRTPPCPRGEGRPCRMSCTLSAARRWGRSARSGACFLPSFLPSFFRWLADVARHPGLVASRRGAGDERGKPLYTPYDPLHPLSAWRRASLSHVVYPVRRSPLGAVGAERGLFPFFFLSLACGCCPASGLGRLPAGAGGERGQPLYTPYDPLHPLSAWRRASLSHVVYPVRRSPLGAVGAHLPVLCTGDMRACCGAPALRGSPPRPGSLVGGMFSGLYVEQRGASFYSRNRLFDSVSRISNGKPFLPPVIMGGMFRLWSGSDHSALLTQAWQGAEEIAAPKGAEAPTPDGRSSRGGAGQRESERPLPRGREERGGRPA